ncbi:MAG: Dam family site-specific DNA-(adenine-N6)-methyltransferase [Bacillota bacterium]
MRFVKSPLNYVGGKHKLLHQILPVFPSNINTFVDLFTGGCNVGINVHSKKIICNDIQTEVVDLMRYMKATSHKALVDEIESIIEEYGLSRSDLYGYEYYGVNSGKGLVSVNKSAFEDLRHEYNNDTNQHFNKNALFYTLVIFFFNNAIRFNENNQYNQSCNKRDFNKNLRKSLESFMLALEDKEIHFTNSDFRKFNFSNLTTEDFVYCDPPYFISDVAYNQSNHKWSEEDELDLFKTLDVLNEKGIKFALSNVTKNKGKENNNLINWMNQYRVIDLNHSYKNSYFSSKDKSDSSTSEVLIVNYA